MATKQDVLEVFSKLQSDLSGLATSGDYSDAEMSVLFSLSLGVSLAVRSFFEAPCCGDSSDRYDAPFQAAADARSAAVTAVPGAITQLRNRVEIAVHSLQGVTTPSGVMAALVR